MKKFGWVSLACTLALSTFLTACGGGSDTKEATGGAEQQATVSGEPIVIKFVHAVAEDSSKGKAASLFAKLVNEKMAGKVKVEVYPNSSLFDEAAGLEALQAGNIHLMAPATSKLVGFDPAFQLFDLPFLFKSNEEFLKFANGENGEKLRQKIEPHGYKIIDTWIGGFKQMTNSKHAISKPEDFKDIKMRVMSGGLLEEQYSSLGAGVTVIPFSELYMALQQGTVDGQENSYLDIATMKFQEVQKYLTITNHAPATFQVITNKEFWDGLPADVRTQLEEIMKEVTKEEIKMTEELDQKAYEELKASGKLELTELTPEQRQAFVDKFQPLYDKYAKTIGEDLVKAALEFK